MVSLRIYTNLCLGQAQFFRKTATLITLCDLVINKVNYTMLYQSGIHLQEHFSQLQLWQPQEP